MGKKATPQSHISHIMPLANRSDTLSKWYYTVAYFKNPHLHGGEEPLYLPVVQLMLSGISGSDTPATTNKSSISILQHFL